MKDIRIYDKQSMKYALFTAYTDGAIYLSMRTESDILKYADGVFTYTTNYGTARIVHDASYVWRVDNYMDLPLCMRLFILPFVEILNVDWEGRIPNKVTLLG